MEENTKQGQLRELLALASQLRERGGPGLTTAESTTQERLRWQSILSRLRSRFELQTDGASDHCVIGDLGVRHGLSPNHQMLLVLLLAERIAEGPRFVSGRALLTTMARDLYLSLIHI